jgi:RNA polymerase sigma factor (sigma-70 family)
MRRVCIRRSSGVERMMEADADGVTRVDPVAFEDCFRELFPDVARAAALIVRDPTLGPDLAQEAFVRLYERWDRIASPEHARNFAFRVAINLARSHLRRHLATPVGLRGPDRPTQDPTEKTNEWIVVTDALSRLSGRQRACVVLVDFAEIDPAGVARILGMAEGTVRVHVSRGRRALRAHLAIAEEDR